MCSSDLGDGPLGGLLKLPRPTHLRLKPGGRPGSFRPLPTFRVGTSVGHQALGHELRTLPRLLCVPKALPQGSRFRKESPSASVGSLTTADHLIYGDRRLPL